MRNRPATASRPPPREHGLWRGCLLALIALGGCGDDATMAGPDAQPQGPTCGDGVVDLGEACDNGMVGQSAGGCSPQCTLEILTWSNVTPPAAARPDVSFSGAWVARSFANPPARYKHAAAVDLARGRTVVFGGGGDQGVKLADTWVFDGTNWLQIPSTGPVGQYDHAMAFDAARNKVVFVGGTETWEFDGATWAQLTPIHQPPRRGAHAMAFDPALGKVVLFGGYGGDLGGPLADTWTFDGTDWTQVSVAGPSARAGASMVFDPDRGALLLFGGATGGVDHDDTWTFDGTSWMEIPMATRPRARAASALAYDAARRAMILFGGNASGVIVDDTWELKGTTWAPLAPVSRPPARLAHTLTFDPAHGKLILFGGFGLGPGHFADTWTLGYVSAPAAGG